jgi:hypothetical protein
VKKVETNQQQAPPSVISPCTTPTWKKGGLTATDLGKVGIQMGKTKVFLRHKAFETLECIRSSEQSKSATKLNSMFRRYLARVAYIPYRNAYRMALLERRRRFESDGDGEEKKDMDMDFSELLNLSSYDSSLGGRYHLRSMFMHNGGNFASDSLVDKWTESQIRESIHNPTARHRWGKEGPSEEMEKFKWVLDNDGLWIKNYSVLQT